MQRSEPPFRADHVGSLLRPAALKDARTRRANGEISAAELTAIEDREIERIIRKQEESGLKSITDGEFRRSWWHLDFLWGLDGVERYAMDRGMAFAGMQTRAEGARIVGKLGFSGHPMLEHFRFIAARTSRTPKMTIPAPPIARQCALSPTPVAVTSSSTKSSSPCCATQATAPSRRGAATIPKSS